MNIGKTLGRLLGRSKKKKTESGQHDEEKPSCSGFQEYAKGDDDLYQISVEKLPPKDFREYARGDDITNKVFEDNIPLSDVNTNYHPCKVSEEKLPVNNFQEFPKMDDERKSKYRIREHDLNGMRVSNNFKFDNDDLPSENEIRRNLLEADRAHKLWKIRRRLKNVGLKPTKELLSIELDEKGPHKWDSIIKKPIMERYICMIQYIRNLAAKEARESGHSALITSETTDKELSKFHKKFRLDFTLNSKGEPSNISLGDDSASSSNSEEEEKEVVSSRQLVKNQSSENIFKDNELNFSKIYAKKYVTPSSSINLLNEIKKEEEKLIEETKSDSSFDSTIFSETFNSTVSSGIFSDKESDIIQSDDEYFSNSKTATSTSETGFTRGDSPKDIFKKFNHRKDFKNKDLNLSSKIEKEHSYRQIFDVSNLSTSCRLKKEELNYVDENYEID